VDYSEFIFITRKIGVTILTIEETAVTGDYCEMLISIDSRSHLEVADKHHRYGKNLRLYFKEYSRLHPDVYQQIVSANSSSKKIESRSRSSSCSGIITSSISGSSVSISSSSSSSSISSSSSSGSSNWSRYDPFFQWLDAGGFNFQDGGDDKPDMNECPRAVLDQDRVLYFTNDAEREQFMLKIDKETGTFIQVSSGLPVTTGAKGWIFVLKKGRFYATEKRTTASSGRPRLHHSSFFSGEGVNAAGLIMCSEGKLLKLYPHSGHYRPHDRHFCCLLQFLRLSGVALSELQVDAQRIFKSSRHTQEQKKGGTATNQGLHGLDLPKQRQGQGQGQELLTEGLSEEGAEKGIVAVAVDKDSDRGPPPAKIRKSDCALFLDGEHVLNFLQAKQKFLESGLMEEIAGVKDEGETATTTITTTTTIITNTTHDADDDLNKVDIGVLNLSLDHP
jgi:hypothetical protein